MWRRQSPGEGLNTSPGEEIEILAPMAQPGGWLRDFNWQATSEQ